jgi:protoporphyrinogen oxidase
MSYPKKTITAIIGGGLTGLTLAALFEKQGEDYLLFESQGEFGGLAKGQLEQGVWLDYGLKSMPVGEDISTNPLIALKKTLNLKIQIESWTEGPQTLDKRGLVPFMGFGESKARNLIEELSYFTQSPRLLISGGWRNLTEALLNQIPTEKRITRAIVTKFDLQDDQVCGIQINGETTIEVKRVVMTLPPNELKNFLSFQQILPKLALKIAKTSPWTAVSLDIAHLEKITDAKSMFIFRDATDLDCYVVGQFVTNADPSRDVGGLQISSWLSLIDSETSLDDELVSKVIKTMKKNIKKAFPQLIEKSAWERLLVIPGSLTQYGALPVEKNGSLSGLNNLFLAGSQIEGAKRNLTNALSSALRLSTFLLPDSKSKMTSPEDFPNLSPEL